MPPERDPLERRLLSSSAALSPGAGRVAPPEAEAIRNAQLGSRHCDDAARSLQAEAHGFYTIGSAGHECNAAVALASCPTDPALLHYRSGGFYLARACASSKRTARIPG